MNYTIADRLIELRRKEGYSQEELADRLFISRQAISKWERAESLPDTENLIALSRLYGISIDELLGTGTINREHAKHNEPAKVTKFGYSGVEVDNADKYEFISDKKTRKGIPFVHIHYRRNIGLKRQKANGVIAIGDNAKGVVAIGRVATGVVSIGAISLGVVSIGAIALGLLSFGVITLSLIAGFGIITAAPIAFGIITVGVIAFGIISVGYAVYGIIAIGEYVNIRNPWE